MDSHVSAEPGFPPSSLPQTETNFWQETLSELLNEGQLGNFELGLLRQSKNLGRTGNNVVLVVPGEMVKTLIETKLEQAIVAKLDYKFGASNTNLLVIVDENLAQLPDPEPEIPFAPPSLNPTSSPNFPAPNLPSKTSSVAIKKNGLNPRYTFDNFVIGPSNSFTAAAAEAVAATSQGYNPLVIYGGPGLGKTHLLHAIGNYALELDQSKRIIYTSAEELKNEFINAKFDRTRHSDQNVSALRDRYREVDMLLIDDIQFLEKQVETLELFFHTFNSLHMAGKQMVITSDVPPRNMKFLDERLISRLEWGVLADLQTPTLETRVAILQKKSFQEGLQVSEEIIQWIAANITTNVRELEGALLRVVAYASLQHQTMTLDLAQTILREMVTTRGTQEITPQMIIEFTAKYFGISAHEITSADRSRTIVGPRQVAMYLCRELTGLSLPKVGEAFGGRDHTTVMHAVKKITATMTEDNEVLQSVTEITNDIRRTVRSS